ncbi:hypothetical protein N431DRAFT_417137 [Stipitochalara longipes BDJ]|nr:hypothetical protein N431DRAFT_417137 [Stipitochalara longipes BDJ]
MSMPAATDLDSLSSNENIVACYRPSPGLGDRDLAHEAYEKAVEYFTEEFAGNEDVQSFLVGYTSITDVQDIVEKAKREYEAKGQKRRTVLRWLSKLSLGIRHYSQALDMLAQHHPEYVALAWGAIKFVLTGVINHEELIEELAKALTLISNVLPGIKLSARLYQTEEMKDAVASMYGHIIRFFQRATRWYNKSSARRALSSILKPFELEYQNTVDQIKLCSDTINNLAQGASRAEIRDVNIIVQLIHGKMQGIEKNLHNMQVQLNEKDFRIISHIDQVLQVAVANKTINEAVQLDVTDMKPRLYRLEFASILDILLPEVSPEKILRKYTSMAIGRRRHQISTGYFQSFAYIAKTLDLWVSTTSSSLFILRSGPRASSTTRDHAVNIINHLRKAQYKVFWILSPPSPGDLEPSISNILRSLVFQIIQQEPNVLLRFPENLNASYFLPNRNESEWLDLLCLLISRLDKCFLIVETEDLHQASRQRVGWTQDFLRIFQRLIHSVEAARLLVKILVVTFGNDFSLSSIQQGSIHNFVATIQQPRVIPPRLRRKLSRPKPRRYSQQASQHSS